MAKLMMPSLRKCALLLMAATLSTAFTPSPPCAAVRYANHILFSSKTDNNVDSHDFDDFAEFSSTQLASSSIVVNNSNGNDGDSFLSSLQSRVQQVQHQSNKLPLMILDTMLPRQVLQIQIQHPTLKSLMKHRVNMETPTLGMLGMARLSTGRMVPLKTGVEVEIIQMEKADVSSTMSSATSSDSSGGNEEPWDISLRGGRRFIIEGDIEKTEEGWTTATVKFLDSALEEENEVKQFSHPSMEEMNPLDRSSTPTTSGDRLSLARAISKCRQFTEPNMNMKDNASLVDRWIQLAKQNERHPGQIDTLLKQLGSIPPEYEPTERALWVGALINPLPSMGVATEIRPALLVSKRAEERVQVALDAILKSIRHMDGSARRW